MAASILEELLSRVVEQSDANDQHKEEHDPTTPEDEQGSPALEAENAPEDEQGPPAPEDGHTPEDEQGPPAPEDEERHQENDEVILKYFL